MGLSAPPPLSHHGNGLEKAASLSAACTKFSDNTNPRMHTIDPAIAIWSPIALSPYPVAAGASGMKRDDFIERQSERIAECPERSKRGLAPASEQIA